MRTTRIVAVNMWTLMYRQSKKPVISGGLPVIDFNSVTGMNPMIEEQLIYFYDSGFDRLHPNTKGQERMARTLMYQLLALPV